MEAIMSNETRELMLIIRGLNLPQTHEERARECLNLLTEDIDEPFLMDRADLFRDTFLSQEAFQICISELASFCKPSVNHCASCQCRKYCNHYIKQKREAVGRESLKMADMFCGAGGLSLGFSQEGFIPVLANDNQECCVNTYAHNHPEVPRNRIILGNIEDVSESIEQILGGENVDIVIGGPPCQGFSEANRQRLIDDPRNHLYKSFVKVVENLKPRFFVMENVKGMSKVQSEVIQDFNKIGYTVEARILNASDFGVPQNRERLIYIGNICDFDNSTIFDEIERYGSTLKPHVLQDALYGLRELQASREKNATEKDSEISGYRIEADSLRQTNDYIDMINDGRKCPIVFNHKARYNNDRDIEIYSRLNPGDKSDDEKIADIMPYKSRGNIFRDKYFKLEPNKICKTITAHMRFDCNMYIHPFQARGLTPREAARIQSYPDDYYFRGSYTKTYMQIGNSVPPLLSRAIAKIIKRYIYNENVAELKRS